MVVLIFTFFMKFVSVELEFYLGSYENIWKLKSKTEGGKKNKKAEPDAQEAAQPSWKPSRPAQAHCDVSVTSP